MDERRQAHNCQSAYPVMHSTNTPLNPLTITLAYTTVGTVEESERKLRNSSRQSICKQPNSKPNDMKKISDASNQHLRNDSPNSNPQGCLPQKLRTLRLLSI